jgi:DNA (cytosine-5)-methyltransferase 1
VNARDADLSLMPEKPHKTYIWRLPDLKNVKKNGLKVFSCFACGGGSSMGYKLAGFEVVGCNEIDPKINKMYVKNLNPKHNFRCDIRDMISCEIHSELYKIDILDGSPPCSVFSIAGEREKNWGKEKKFKEGQKKQRLDDLFIHFLNFANRIKPKIVVAENVKGILAQKSKGYVNEILHKFEEIGYDCQIFLLNSAFMGVPQRRERVFFIGRRKDLNLPKLKLEFNEKVIKYGKFKDSNFIPLNPSTETYKLWHQRKRDDRHLADILKRVEDRYSRFNEKFFYDEKVCPTIASSGGYLRFDVPGRPSAKDFKTIQTFPQDYNFNGQRVQYVCGMSVPPIMMQRIAEQIYIQFLRGKT